MKRVNKYKSKNRRYLISSTRTATHTHVRRIHNLKLKTTMDNKWELFAIIVHFEFEFWTGVCGGDTLIVVSVQIFASYKFIHANAESHRIDSILLSLLCFSCINSIDSESFAKIANTNQLMNERCGRRRRRRRWRMKSNHRIEKWKYNFIELNPSTADNHHNHVFLNVVAVLYSFLLLLHSNMIRKYSYRDAAVCAASTKYCTFSDRRCTYNRIKFAKVDEMECIVTLSSVCYYYCTHTHELFSNGRVRISNIFHSTVHTRCTYAVQAYTRLTASTFFCRASHSIQLHRIGFISSCLYFVRFVLHFASLTCAAH